MFSQLLHIEWSRVVIELGTWSPTTSLSRGRLRLQGCILRDSSVEQDLQGTYGGTCIEKFDVLCCCGRSSSHFRVSKVMCFGIWMLYSGLVLDGFWRCLWSGVSAWRSRWILGRLGGTDVKMDASWELLIRDPRNRWRGLHVVAYVFLCRRRGWNIGSSRDWITILSRY